MINLPNKTKAIIVSLEEAGCEAYAVGGCVRDSLLGRVPVDWDICTSARPDEVKKVFGGFRIIDTGIEHGTVTLMIEGEPFEITTFRLDGEYADNRHPKAVTFTDCITADLARRDFTVNAMAYNPERGLIDPFGGRADLEKRIVRAVGEPGTRFDEDALRILRALRFAITLNFDIEEKTAAAMLSRRTLLGSISAERIRTELVKALMGGKIKKQFSAFREIIAEVVPELRPCFDFEQKTIHHCYDVYEHILTAVDAYDGGNAAVKTALLLHDIAKPQMYKFYNGCAHFKGHPALGAKMAYDILRRLKFDNKTRTEAATLVRYHDVRLNGGMAQMLKLINLVGEETMTLLLQVMRSDTFAQSEYKREEKLSLIDGGKENLRFAVNNNLCRRLNDLKIDGRDAAALGLEGRMIRAALNCCLNAVINGKVKNEREALIDYAAGLADAWKKAAKK